MYKKIDEKLVSSLKSIVGEKNVICDKEKMLDYSHDEFSLDTIHRFPEAVVKPRNRDEVSRLVKLANDERIPLTARGGGTGLCGGCVPTLGGIVMTFENMNQVVEVDENNLMATAEAGAILTDFYEAVEKKGFFFPPHPGDESATIGGIIAANAGGARAVKYGVIRNFIKGIEVVLADGEIITVGGKFIKNSSGYSLLHLFIGSEGTLGIITKAIINLMAPPGAVYTLVAPYQDLQDGIKTVPAIIKEKILPMAVEFVEKAPIKLSEDYLDKKWPASGEAYLMIILDGTNEEEVMKLAERVGEVCLSRGALDVFVADSKEKQKTILDIRSQIYEAMKKYMLEILDITIPRSEIANFVRDVHQIEKEEDIWLPTYGHAADGNVHTHIMKARWDEGKWSETKDWQEKYPRARKRVHGLGRKYRGMVSGEHGIGLVKKEYLPSFLGERQINLMRAIKKSFDPNNILNPGKIF